MNHYTQLNLNNKKSANSDDPNSNRQTGANRKFVMFTGLVLVSALSGSALLMTNGCSKAKSDTPNARVANASELAPPTQSLPAVNPATQPPAPKVIKKRRPTSVTYSDAATGLSFQYPRKFRLTTGDKPLAELADTGSIPMGFVQQGGVALVSVELPKGSYPGTDLVSAFFDANMHRTLSPSECEQFVSSQPGRPGPAPANVLVGGTEFSQFEDVDSASNRETRFYHVFQNGACYEFALGLGVANIVSEEEVTPVNRQDVFGKLEKILSSVKMKKVAESEVAAGTLVKAGNDHQ